MTFTGHSASIRSVFLNNDRTLLVTGSYDNTAKLWDVRTGHCLMTYTGHSGCVRSVYLNDDGTRLLTGSWDDTAKLWDVETGKCLMTYKGHSNAVSSAVLTPDGARVVTGSQDHTIRFWDTESGELLATFHNFYANENSYFYTNRPDLIDVIECDEKDEDNPRILPEDDIRRKAYLKAYNNWGKVRDRIFPPSPDSKATYRDIKDIIAMIKDKEIKRLQPPKWEQGLRRDT
jgi:WD40 repeat protein